MKQVVGCLLLLVTMAVAACMGPEEKKSEVQSVNICSSMSRDLSMALINDFAERTGILVEFDPLVPINLAQRLSVLENSKVDIWLGGFSEEYYMAAERKMLDSYLPATAADLPPQYMDRANRWLPVSVDHIALLSNLRVIRNLGIKAPETWEELLQPVLYKEITMSDPEIGGASFGQITSIWQLRGQEAALRYAGLLRTQEVAYLPTDAKAGYEVYSGNKSVAILSLSHARALEKEHHFLYAVPVKDGNKNMITAAAILKKGVHKRASQRFMDYLLTPEAARIMRKYGMKPLADTLYQERQKMQGIQIPYDDLYWIASSKQQLIKAWLNAR